MRRRFLASLVLAVSTGTLAINAPHNAALHLVSAQGLGQPAVVQDVPPAYTGPTHESLAVTMTRVMEAKRQQELAFYAEATRQIEERAAYAAAHPRTQTTRRVVDPPPVPPQVSYESGTVEAIIADVFGPYAAKAIRIAQCESGLNPAARNRSGAVGLFQLLGHGDMFVAHGWSPDDWADPYKNAIVAFDLSSGGTSWGAWVCRG